MMLDKKPTRKQLLAVINDLQNKIGSAMGLHGNDRDPTGYERGQKLLEAAFQICIDAQRFDPPGKMPSQKPNLAKPIEIPKCDQCNNIDLHRFEYNGVAGWSCDGCGWSWDD